MSYGRLNEPKLRDTDYILSCEQARQELGQYLDQQARRVNIDSAKKRAVLQHMDYEGFRQMVLGAQIFPTKSTQLYNFSKGESKTLSANKQFDQRKVETGLKSQQYEEKVQGKSEMHCNSFREFKKKFMSRFPLKNSLENPEFNKNVLFCYNLIKEQNQQRLSKIFNTECEGDILLKIVDIFDAVLNQMSQKQSEYLENEGGFMLLFFRVLSSISTMSEMTLLILSKKQKQKIADFILGLQKILKQPEIEGEIQRISKLFAK